MGKTGFEKFFNFFKKPVFWFILNVFRDYCAKKMLTIGHYKIKVISKKTSY